ncbi:MAG: SDR family NAD(P)-dependent oxidoreductase, partial [Casimicrobium sp.]
MSKVVLVTGASGNLGRAVASKFARDGARVIGFDRATHSDLVNVEQHVVDMQDEAATMAAVSAVLLDHGHVDVAVLTVGGFAMGSIAETTTAQIAAQYKLNFESTYNVVRPLLGLMLTQGSGRIFLIGARPALSGANGKGMTAYSLAKSLVFHLAELMNEEARAAGADVVTSVIVPSIIDTPQNRKDMPSADFSKWVTP